MKPIFATVAVVTSLSMSVAMATPVTETFNGMGDSGTEVNSFSGGSIITKSNGSFDQAIIFNTNNLADSSDGDLEAPVTRKSSGVVEDIGNVLIITERGGDHLPGDDEQRGGQIAFNFDFMTTVYSLDFVDTGEDEVTVSFFGEAINPLSNDVLPVALSTFIITLDLDTGDNLPNYFDTFMFGTGVSGVVSMLVDFGSNSGAIDNLVYDAVPVPAALPLFAAGLAGIGLARRRRQAA